MTTTAVALVGLAATTASASPWHHSRYEAAGSARHHPPAPSSSPSSTPTAPPTQPAQPSSSASSSVPSTPAAPSTSTTSTTSTTSAPAPSSSSTTSAPASAGPLGISGSWRNVFSDSFANDSALDTTKWSTGWNASGITRPPNWSEDDCYDPAQVSVTGGTLNLTAIQKAVNCGQAKDYTSGLVNTNGKFNFTYGAMEARIYLPAGSDGKIANWPAFWADGQNWPTDGETDVMEGLTGDACYHFHSTAGGPGGCASGNYTGWHTYGADWEPGSVTYYYDGVKVGQITTGITSVPQYLILNNAVGGYGGTTLAPSTMKVDYVKVWQH
ncbi:family 16 glycosylhydrolase [Catenulispora sp. GP43]|uniref:glycoside hydrolase family 16 protein n=1 Tax=Catenulispora sp. GP43 TaxID=3156263 RepID=UPI003518CCC9